MASRAIERREDAEQSRAIERDRGFEITKERRECVKDIFLNGTLPLLLV